MNLYWYPRDAAALRGKQSFGHFLQERKSRFPMFFFYSVYQVSGLFSFASFRSMPFWLLASCGFGNQITNFDLVRITADDNLP